jgi:hypothetical protein
LKGGDDDDGTYTFLGWILVDISDDHDVLLFLRYAQAVLVREDERGHPRVLVAPPGKPYFGAGDLEQAIRQGRDRQGGIRAKKTGYRAWAGILMVSVGYEKQGVTYADPF